VIICHGSSGDRAWGFLPELAERLARAGLAVVSFDFSDQSVASQLHELDLVLESLKRGTVGVATTTYGLIGHDTGAAVALLRSAADERVRALVTCSVMARFGAEDVTPETLSAARALRMPWLLVHGTADESVPLQDARALRGAAPGDAVELLVLEGGSHAFGTQHPWTGSNPILEQLVRASIAWLGRYLP
jgi:pimeloyl-ACP methyl ester carboxylesterase